MILQRFIVRGGGRRKTGPEFSNLTKQLTQQQNSSGVFFLVCAGCVQKDVTTISLTLIRPI